MKKSTKSGVFFGVGLACLSVAQMELYIDKFISLVCQCQAAMPPWAAPLGTGIGLLLIVIGVLFYLYPNNIIMGMSPDYQCHTARREDLQSIYDMGRLHWGDVVSSTGTMKRWHDKNRHVFSVLYRVTRNDFRETRTMVGYFCVIPLVKKAVEKLMSGEIRAVQLQPEDIAKPNSRCSAVYIGAIVGTTIRARGNILSILHREITSQHSKRCSVFLTRPISQDGLRLVKKFKFSPVGASEGIDALYTFRLEANG